jgi:7,8-dihydropterin-6-yl-methyl-4-(beta-D-ribofuranosyl)aminobenzene 5'-phosphate synthase
MNHSTFSIFCVTATCITTLVILALVLLRPRTAYCDASLPEAIPPESTGSITLTVLYDNYRYGEDLETGWGFSCLVEGLEKTILFDTGGDGRILLHNMEKLGVTPDEIDIIVLSHNHQDHTGGLGGFLAANHSVAIFVPVSFPDRFKSQLRYAGATVVPVSHGCRICEGAQSTGEVGTGIREQALCVNTIDGLFVITGCAHPGILQVVQVARELSPAGVWGVMGGFHMKGFSAKEIGQIIGGLKESGISVALPCHCSGDLTRQMMRESFKNEYGQMGVGATVELRVGARTSSQR